MSPEELYGDKFGQRRYYKSGGVEAIDVIEAFAAGNVHRSHALKYLLRAGRKDTPVVEDLDKAIWWINRERAKLIAEATSQAACHHTRLSITGPCPKCAAKFDEHGKQLAAEDRPYPKVEGCTASGWGCRVPCGRCSAVDRAVENAPPFPNPDPGQEPLTEEDCRVADRYKEAIRLSGVRGTDDAGLAIPERCMHGWAHCQACRTGHYVQRQNRENQKEGTFWIGADTNTLRRLVLPLYERLWRVKDGVMQPL